MKILYGFRLYFICYCCERMIMPQWNDLRLLELAIDEDNKKDNNPQIENTEYGTEVHDITVNHGKIEMRDMNLVSRVLFIEYFRAGFICNRSFCHFVQNHFVQIHF